MLPCRWMKLLKNIRNDTPLSDWNHTLSRQSKIFTEITHVWLTAFWTISMKPLNAGKWDALTISAHDLSISHAEAGFANGFSKATPPVSKNFHSWSSTSPLKQKLMVKLIGTNFIWNQDNRFLPLILPSLFTTLKKWLSIFICATANICAPYLMVLFIFENNLKYREVSCL